MYKISLIALSVFLLTSCNHSQNRNGAENDIVQTDTLPAQKMQPFDAYIDESETLRRIVNFDTTFQKPFFKDLDFKPCYWISKECFIAITEKMQNANLSGIRIYFGAEKEPDHSTSIQWIGTKAVPPNDAEPDFSFKFALPSSLNPELYGIDLDETAAKEKRENFALYYRKQPSTNLSIGAKGILDNVSSACLFNSSTLSGVAGQIKNDHDINGLHLYTGAYYNGKDEARANRKFDVQTTLMIVATKTDQENNVLIDDWDFLKKEEQQGNQDKKVLNHATLCPNQCN